MYMSGNTISIFPIMMVIMMMVRPLKTLFTVKQTFKGFEMGPGGIATSTIGRDGVGAAPITNIKKPLRDSSCLTDFMLETRSSLFFFCVPKRFSRSRFQKGGSRLRQTKKSLKMAAPHH